MAAVAVAGHATEHGPGAKGGPMAAVAGRDLGVHSYYQGKIDEMELVVRDRTQNLERLKAQRNELNAKVRLLREELHHLQESGSYVGEVVKAMGKKKVRVGGVVLLFYCIKRRYCCGVGVQFVVCLISGRIRPGNYLIKVCHAPCPIARVLKRGVRSGTTNCGRSMRATSTRYLVLRARTRTLVVLCCKTL